MRSLFRKFSKYKLWDLARCCTWVEKEEPKVLSGFPGSLTEEREVEEPQVVGEGEMQK